MVISDVIEYKGKIMSKLLSIPDIFTLINNKDISKPYEMINKNIFSYMKVPNTTTLVKNYICFDYNTKISARNDSYKNVLINVGIICHKDEINTMWGNRHDVISGVIVDVFNLSNFLGYQLELVSDTESIMENGYHARTLQFRNLTLNSFENGVKVNGVR